MCHQSLVLDHLFAFFWENVEFCQVIFNIIPFSGLTYKNNEAGCFILYCSPVLTLIYLVVNTLYESYLFLNHSEDFVRLIMFSYFFVTCKKMTDLNLINLYDASFSC